MTSIDYCPFTSEFRELIQKIYVSNLELKLGVSSRTKKDFQQSGEEPQNAYALISFVSIRVA